MVQAKKNQPARMIGPLEIGLIMEIVKDVLIAAALKGSELHDYNVTLLPRKTKKAKKCILLKYDIFHADHLRKKTTLEILPSAFGGFYFLIDGKKTKT